METQTKRKVEVFTAGCSVCEPVVEMVKSMACSYCDVVVYNLAETARKSQIKLNLTALKHCLLLQLMESFCPAVKIRVYPKQNLKVQELANGCNV